MANLYSAYSELSKNYRARETHEFLLAHPELNFVEPYAGPQSFTLGKNAYEYPAIIDIAGSRGIIISDFIRGFIFAHVELESSELVHAPKPRQTLTDFHGHIHHMLQAYPMKITDKTQVIQTYLSKVDFDVQNFPFLVDELKTFNVHQRENILKTVLKKNPDVVIKVLSSGVFDINETFPTYESSVAHHWCFANLRKNTGIPQTLADLGFDINVVNASGHSVISSLLTATRYDTVGSMNLKMEVAIEFIDAFQERLDINQKVKSKTYMHQVVGLINQYENKNLESSKNLMITIFERLLKYHPSTEVRSGMKSKGANILGYIERWVANKDLAHSLKDKILIEQSLKDIQTPAKSRSFKL